MTFGHLLTAMVNLVPLLAIFLSCLHHPHHLFAKRPDFALFFAS